MVRLKLGPAAKITEIQQFTPVAWAKAQTVALAA